MNTSSLRSRLLSLAIQGQLVPQDPNDEPASAFLARIQAEKANAEKGKKRSAKPSLSVEDAPFEVPEGWCWTTLGEISNYGETINVSVEDIDDEDWILELEDIEKDSAKILQKLRKKDRAINGTRHEFKQGDILYSKLRTYLNKVLIAPEDGCCTTEIMCFGTYGVLCNEYIRQVLRSKFFLDYTEQCGYGVKMPRLGTSDACKGLIPLPPLPEQHRITRALTALFAQIDKIDEAKATLRTLVQRAKAKVLDLAIHGKLVPQLPEEESAAEVVKRIQEERNKDPKRKKMASAPIKAEDAPFELPEGWCWTTLGVISNYGETINVSVEDIDDEEWVLELEDIEKDSAKILQKLRKKDRAINGTRHEFKKGDILYSKLRTYLNKVLIAPEDGCCTTEIMCFGTYGVLCNEYICQVLKSKFFLDYTEQCGYGVKMPRLGTSDACKGLVPLPPLSEQRRIVAKIGEIFRELERIEGSL